MIIRIYRIDGQKGQKQIAQDTTLSLGSISYRPERAKAQSLFCFLPFRAIPASPLPKSIPWAMLSLLRWVVSAYCRLIINPCFHRPFPFFAILSLAIV